ncbi:hypothetical protein GGTG_09314 [Gaeumannomyces tritici R3-111a-1]|uniref:Uncharacterized protein n=1 Tax=Gaeumannomyces tritici (strain R3-111a-1) TaxID=644352 RepID=J3P717_GAET3|nr:hypothetical protein GGTG_09314 [Gaeumannomyces tritici R3-111a-1]EJT72448.1 hypothetical protein GGTG_09314 [Gaeumannomyces tritici R3-111a-1]
MKIRAHGDSVCKRSKLKRLEMTGGSTTGGGVIDLWKRNDFFPKHAFCRSSRMQEIYLHEM